MRAVVLNCSLKGGDALSNTQLLTDSVISALEDTGSTTPRIVLHFGTPSASAASRMEFGTSRSAS